MSFLFNCLYIIADNRENVKSFFEKIMKNIVFILMLIFEIILSERKQKRNSLPSGQAIAFFVFYLPLLNVTEIEVPMFGVLWVEIVALWILAACFTIERPRPVPPISFERLLSTQ